MGDHIVHPRGVTRSLQWFYGGTSLTETSAFGTASAVPEWARECVARVLKP
jgi:hypothetical protein